MRGNLSRQTAETLYRIIVAEGRVGPGDKLPNELELSRELGVSRATLREAIQALTMQGVLEVHRGRGTFVSRQVGELEDFGFRTLDGVRGKLRDLFELRAMFEPGVAALACARASREELTEILSLGKDVEDCIRSGRDRTQADRDFHAAIVRATHNEFMMRLLPIIGQAVETAIVSGEHGDKLAQDTLRDHALLMEFFEKRDPAGAEHAMAIHMLHAMEEMGLEK
ncbi:FadR/GntR family transcriptional regulator [Lawsonibacter sp. LCP25S3_G6]|uniref:FadR/GntR family transcriptional regulator n=1 Tax=unclassified Lawsonibacter TaxID=2617946 RepID=UPI003F981AED